MSYKNNNTGNIMTSLQKKVLRTSLALVSTLVLGACSKDQLVGNGLRTYTIDHALPIILQVDDVPMICHANDGFTPIVKAFTRFNVETDMMLAFGYAGSSICTESEAVEKELWSSLSEKQGWTDVAIDARIAQQLLNRDAGRKKINAFNHTVSYFRKQYHYEFGEGKCPKLKQEVEELLLFVGATSALQALNNDVSSGRLVNVDMGIPPKVAHAMECLDNAKWWGFPQSLRAALTIILPESPEIEAEGWKSLQQNAVLGLQQGMRVGYATYAVIAAIKGRDDHLRLALKGFESVNPDKINKDYLLLDTIAEQQVRHLANRFWMRLEGRRAPTEGYSQFLDEKRQPDKNLEGLLDDV
jgi:hypothetical protein